MYTSHVVVRICTPSEAFPDPGDSHVGVMSAGLMSLRHLIPSKLFTFSEGGAEILPRIKRKLPWQPCVRPGVMRQLASRRYTAYY